MTGRAKEICQGRRTMEKEGGSNGGVGEGGRRVATSKEQKITGQTIRHSTGKANAK